MSDNMETDNSDIEDISEEIRKKPNRKKNNQDTSVNQFRKKKHGWIKWTVIGLLAAGIIGFVVYKVLDTKNKVEAALGESTTTTAEITRMDISKAISTTGTIQSKDVRTITSPLSGVKIDKVHFKVGETVQEGDVVVEFSFEDINKKIGQIEEDITEAKTVKGLDEGDRKNTYVNSYDLQTYNVAMAYDTLQQKGDALQKAKDDLAKICNEKGDYKSLHEEAQSKRESVEKEYIEKQAKLKASTDPDETARLTIEVEDLSNKLAKYSNALGDKYDSTIKEYEEKEKSAQRTVDDAQKAYDNAFVDFNKKGYDASFNNAKSDYTLNKGNASANDNVKSLERQLEQNQDSLDNYIVTAPISGVITAVNAQEGNGYQATTGALFTVQAIDVFEVTTQVDEYDINNVKIGQKVAIMTDATGDDELEGRVTFIAPTATAATGNSTSNTFEVKMDIVNKDERLKLGMSAKLNILVDTHDNVLAVPYDAIEEKDGGQTVIYVAQKEDKPEQPEEGQPVIQVFGEDGLLKNTGDKPAKPDKPGAAGKMGNAKEIPVQIGLESDYYTEIISPEIKEGMTVLVNSKAGEIKNDMDMFMGM
ncbi:MAG: efflux RND transporter periplasmic adaptor subunit [Lachnospiraceae bacterium]|nr:efflux RND transporter periplasmic adaptor subunit [Lachnospiraceae bacterium]